ncbi:MAG: metallophosphoesterase [Magnetococcales bacterium]|nr:metallophosphoesterase [Magnetococcales bacterium]
MKTNTEYTILWIDDHWSEKRDVGDTSASAAYDNLCSFSDRLQHSLGAYSRMIRWVKVIAPSAATAMILGEKIDFAIVDFEVPSVDKKYDLPRVIDDIIGKCIPFCFLTNYPGGVKIFVDLLSKEKLSHFKGIYTKELADVSRLGSCLLSFFQIPSFSIVHLSDLHFSSVQNGSTTSLAGEQVLLYEALIDFFEKHKSQFNFDALVITGDMAAKKPEVDLQIAREYIRLIAEKTISLKNLERMFIVPGNHDLTWSNFDALQISSNPWKNYVDFFNAVYIGYDGAIQQLDGWTGSGLPATLTGPGLSWRRELSYPNIDIIGISTVNASETSKGNGLVTQNHISYIKGKWSNSPGHFKTRILLQHHNIMPVYSGSTLDKRTILENPGSILNCLSACHCNIILSGHTHFPEVHIQEAYKRNQTGLIVSKPVICISAGSTGNVFERHPNYFNILKFHSLDPVTKTRKLSINHVQYISDDGKWSLCNDPIDLTLSPSQ